MSFSDLITSPQIIQDISGRWRAKSEICHTMANGRDASNEALRNYLAQLEPLDLGATSFSKEDTTMTPSSAASTKVGEDFGNSPVSGFPSQATNSFWNHRIGPLQPDSPPHSLLNALSSRTTTSSIPPSISVATSLTNSLTSRRQMTHSRESSGVTNRLLVPISPEANSWSIPTPSTAKFAALRSPCFYHQRFDDAINIDRVIEEIDYEGDGMSTSRLMQTATSVREISKQLQRRPIKKPIRSIMIVTKARDNSLVYLTRELALWLLSTPRYGSDIGVNVYVDAKLKNSKRFDAEGIVAQDERFNDMLKYWDPDLCWSSPERFDLVLTLGGDGTVLFTSFCLFQRIVPPVLAFSLGSLGFLTNFEFDSYQKSLNSIMGDAGMRVNLRMRFTCTVFRANPNRRKGTKTNPINTTEMIEGEKFEVLNELVIDRGPSAYVSNLELYGDDELMTVVQADGCIISTPTGSTAYALSAGGPLTHPSIPGMVLAPICPHTLSFRPMVLSDAILLKVCVPRHSRSTAYASFDGKNRVELRRGDCIQVEAGRYPFPTVVGEHGTGGEWFESVRRALKWNTRGAMQKSFSSKKNKKTMITSATAASKLNLHPDVVDEEMTGDEEDDVEEDEDEYDEEEELEDEWDIDPDEPSIVSTMDSGVGTSIASSSCASPRRQNSIMGSPYL